MWRNTFIDTNTNYSNLGAHTKHIQNLKINEFIDVTKLFKI
jgi:hypothetical protein